MPLAPGDLFAVPLPDGFGALQVTALTPDGAVVCLLDWHSAGLFTADDVAEAGLFRLTHHGHTGGRQTVHVSEPPPGEFLLVGNGPVADRPTGTNVFCALAARAGVAEADADRWFDEWRDF
ncbi:hypothetical protein BJY16_004640 [Actinoplanes octamycinicus]|uniref:Uncharacterized protein n=1 Tax=Actinoplanes octamycinicus TaxID=135948 RepID=A0A7W7M8V7_9ACTN|nr:hypothetical protein [Actinoplanes octamycinicus]MBB4741181.1 hypothetical protein [Actinoplanes octamycinicus]GIE56087.1 hypothetical protein Aoc01nite_14890 [Actinoplanes octamycinicus]